MSSSTSIRYDQKGTVRIAEFVIPDSVEVVLHCTVLLHQIHGTVAVQYAHRVVFILSSINHEMMRTLWGLGCLLSFNNP